MVVTVEELHIPTVSTSSRWFMRFWRRANYSPLYLPLHTAWRSNCQLVGLGGAREFAVILNAQETGWRDFSRSVRIGMPKRYYLR